MPEQITRISDSLIEEVYEQEHVNPQTASPVMLRHVINILNGRFEFMQDPQIAQHHHEVITTLFAIAAPLPLPVPPDSVPDERAPAPSGPAHVPSA